MMMQLNRDHVHVSNRGISIGFKAGVPTHVPPMLIQDVVALGGTVSDEVDKGEVDKEMALANELALAAGAKAPAIEAAVRTLVKRNQRGDFTAGNKPNLNVLAKLLGYTVTSDELEPIWKKVRAEIQ